MGIENVGVENAAYVGFVARHEHVDNLFQVVLITINSVHRFRSEIIYCPAFSERDHPQNAAVDKIRRYLSNIKAETLLKCTPAKK